MPLVPRNSLLEQLVEETHRWIANPANLENTTKLSLTLVDESVLFAFDKLISVLMSLCFHGIRFWCRHLVCIFVLWSNLFSVCCCYICSKLIWLHLVSFTITLIGKVQEIITVQISAICLRSNFIMSHAVYNLTCVFRWLSPSMGIAVGIHRVSSVVPECWGVACSTEKFSWDPEHSSHW